MKNQIILFMSIIFMVFLCLPGTRARASVSEESDYIYEDYNGGIRILGYQGSATKLTLPDTIDGKKVIALFDPDTLGDRGPQGFEDVTSLVIPDCITDCALDFFYYTSSFPLLYELKIGSGIQEVFFRSYSDNLKRLTVGSDKTGNQKVLFSYHKQFDYLEIKSSVDSLNLSDSVAGNTMIIDGVENLERICYDEDDEPYVVGDLTITNSNFVLVSGIWLTNLKSLQSVHISNCTSSLGGVGIHIQGCDNLTSVSLSDVNIAIENEVSSLIVSCCPKLVNLEMSNLGLQTLNYGAFGANPSLREISFTGHINQVYSSAFANSGYERIYFYEGVDQIEGWAFSNCTSLVDIDFGDNPIIIKNCIFQNCTSLQVVEFPIGSSLNGDKIFEGCESLEKAYLGFDSINYSGGRICGPTLKEVVFTGNLTQIPDYFFTECPNLERVILPKSLRVIGYRAFYETSIEFIQIPENVEKIDKNAFSDCIKLESVIFTGGTKDLTIDSFAFMNDTSLTTLILPDNLCRISNSMCVNCTSLKNVRLSASCIRIEYDAFRNCTSLESIVLPEGIEEIEIYAFFGCISLETVVFPTTLKFIGDHAFYETAMKSAYLPCDLGDVCWPLFFPFASQKLKPGEEPFRLYVTDKVHESLSGELNIYHYNTSRVIKRITYFGYPEGKQYISDKNEYPEEVILARAYRISSIGTSDSTPEEGDAGDVTEYYRILLRTDSGQTITQGTAVCSGQTFTTKTGYFLLETGNLSGEIDFSAEGYEPYRCDIGILSKTEQNIVTLIQSAPIYDFALTAATIQYNYDYMDVLTTEYQMSKINYQTEKAETFNIFCEAVDAYAAKQYLLFQNDKLLGKSEDGKFRGIRHSQIETGSGFSVIVIGVDDTKKRTGLKLVISGIVEMYEAEFAVLSDSCSIKIPDNIPYIGGMSFEADIEDLPVCIVKEDGFIKFGMNIDRKFLLTNGGKKSGMVVLSSVFNQLKRGNLGKEEIKEINKYSEKAIKSAFGPVKVEISGLGYGITPYNEEDRFNAIGAEVAVAAEISGDYTWRTIIYMIPFSFSIESKFQVQVGSKLMYNLDEDKFTGDVKAEAKLEFEPFVAVGLNDTLRGGVYGNAESTVSFIMLTADGSGTGLEKITFTGKGGLQFRYLGKKYKWVWKEAEYQLYPGEVTEITAGGGGR